MLERGTVAIADIEWAAEVADTREARRIGLGGRDSLPELSGMLFVFETGLTTNFWMGGMKFPLDFIWISEDCTVSEITPDAPILATSTQPSNVRIYQSAVPTKYTFEINAGEAAYYDIQLGDKVRFEGIKDAGC